MKEGTGRRTDEVLDVHAIGLSDLVNSFATSYLTISVVPVSRFCGVMCRAMSLLSSFDHSFYRKRCPAPKRFPTLGVLTAIA